MTLLHLHLSTPRAAESYAPTAAPTVRLTPPQESFARVSLHRKKRGHSLCERSSGTRVARMREGCRVVWLSAWSAGWQKNVHDALNYGVESAAAELAL